MSLPVTAEDITIVLSCLPGEKECIEDVSRAARMRTSLREVIKTTPRYINIVEALVRGPKITGNSLGFLLTAPIEAGTFIYPVTDSELETLRKFPGRFNDAHPMSTSLLRAAIDVTFDSKNKLEPVKVETAKPTLGRSAKHALYYFRKYPEDIRHGVKGQLTPVYYTSTDMINIFNTLSEHDRTHKDRREDPILAVGPMTKTIYDLMQFPTGFPREGYAPVLDLEAKILLLVPLSTMEQQYEVLTLQSVLALSEDV